MRTRTRAKIIFTTWVIIMATVIIIGNTIQERSNAAALLAILIGGDTVDWIAHIAGVVTENIKGVKRNAEKPLGKS